MRQVAISGREGKLRVALIEGGRLREWRTEHPGTEVLVGDIYQGRVADVLPGIQSAFVDIGVGKNAYLYVDDALPVNSSAPDKPSISGRVRAGEKILVQVSKESTELKAPKVTARISFQGRYLVFLPREEGISISRKIGDEAKRERLKETVSGLLGTGEGVIVRTEAADAGEEKLANELAYLRRRWQEASDQAKGLAAPGRVCRDANLIEAMVRDFLPAGVDELVVEDGATYRQVKEVISLFDPDQLDKLRWYQANEPLLAYLGVEAQLNRVLQRQVPLQSGGHLVIDRTEAMTVIDVNTGAFTGKGGQQREQAVTSTNLEAAAEIACQLRLRDIGGIIIIDFIDMKETSNRERLLVALRRELARDPVPATVLGITALGLVEMTRKRVRPSLEERLTEPCVSCGGSGRVESAEEQEQRLWSETAALARGQEADAVLVQLPTRLYQRIAEQKTDWPVRLYKLHVPALLPQEYRILYAGREEEAERLYRKQL